MKNINRYGCGNGEGMFDDKEGYWVTHEDYKQLLDKCEKLALTIPVVVKSLKDKEAPTLKDAFVAGYKKRALMSGLKYDEVSELNAITNFKCWKSFDLNL